MPPQLRQFPALACAVLLTAALCTVLCKPSALRADVVKTIVATVNDEPISSYDINQRVLLAILSSNINPTPEIIERIRGQVLRNLIDDKLRLQEINRLKVPVEKAEIDAEIERIAKQSGESVDQFKKSLAKQGIAIDTLREQLKVDIGWAKLVRGRFSHRINVTDQEVDYAYKQAVERANDPRYLISEIYLDVPSPAQEKEVYKSAADLLQQIRKGASFPLVAQQFSQSISAAQGGDLGWVEASDLDEDVAKALARMSPGQISPPIRAHDAIVIVALRDRYFPGKGDPLQSTVSMRQLFLTFSGEPSESQMQKAMEEAGKIRGEIKGCSSLERMAKKYDNAVPVDAETYRIANLPGPIQQAVLPLQAGQVSVPLASGNGVHLFVICSRKDVEVQVVEPTRQNVQVQLMNQELSDHARRYIRDLRADATIDYLH